MPPIVGQKLFIHHFNHLQSKITSTSEITYRRLLLKVIKLAATKHLTSSHPLLYPSCQIVKSLPISKIFITLVLLYMFWRTTYKLGKVTINDQIDPELVYFYATLLPIQPIFHWFSTLCLPMCPHNFIVFMIMISQPVEQMLSSDLSGK